MRRIIMIFPLISLLRSQLPRQGEALMIRLPLEGKVARRAG
jgi:hypothetical protein